MKLLRRMNKSNNRKNSGFTLVELVIVMAIMGILGLAVAGFIGTSTKQYKYASKDVDLQYEAQLTMNQIGDLIIDAQKGVKYEPATVAAPVEVASANPEAGYVATASAEEGQAEETSSEETSSDSKLIIYNKDCTYYIIYRPSEHKIYLRKDTLDPATGVVKADGQGKESLMAENVTGFTPDLSEAESKNSVGIVVDFKAGDKKYTSKQNFTMRNKVPTGADVEYVAPEEPISVHIYYGGRDVSGQSISYVRKDNSNVLEFTSKILGGNNPSQEVTWSYTGRAADWNGTTFNPSGNTAKLSIGVNETSKQFVVKVTSKEDISKYTSVTINVVDTRNWLNNQEMQDVLVPGATRKTWLEPENIKNSGIEYDPDDFEWHIETYQYIDGTKIKINNDNNLNDNYGVLNNNSEEKGEYGGGNYLSYHIDKTKHLKGEFNQTIAVTSGLNLYDKEYDLLIWVTLKSDPSIGSNIITLRCRPHN